MTTLNWVDQHAIGHKLPLAIRMDCSLEIIFFEVFTANMVPECEVSGKRTFLIRMVCEVFVEDLLKVLQSKLMIYSTM